MAWFRALMFTGISTIELFWGRFQMDVPPELRPFTQAAPFAILLSC